MWIDNIYDITLYLKDLENRLDPRYYLFLDRYYFESTAKNLLECWEELLIAKETI